MNPYQVVKDFEKALCDYTGAKYAVTCTSCTMALLLACAWYREPNTYLYSPGDIENGFIPKKEKIDTITIPKKTYVGVPMSIIHAGFDVAFEDKEWKGMYQLEPLPVWDSARYFTGGLFEGNQHGIYANWGTGRFFCTSFHWSKTLAIGQGGAILHDNDEADEWLREMRFDGRIDGISAADQGAEQYRVIGYHANMSPRDAAEGLSRLAVLPEHNDPLPNDDYPDLSRIEIFQ